MTLNPQPCATRSATEPLLVAVDGPAGAGKSTIAVMLARRLGLPYLDTGAMYRVVGLLAQRASIRPPFAAGTGKELVALVNKHQIEAGTDPDRPCILLDNEDVSSAIRTPEASRFASAISTLSEIRQALVPLQRRLGAGGGVMEGRDIGTVVFPQANLKIFLTATPEARALRRFRDLEVRGLDLTLEDVLREQLERDNLDSSRADSPLKVAPGAVVVDTTDLNPDEVVERIVCELAGQEQAGNDQVPV